jgi:hypothetical protein
VKEFPGGGLHSGPIATHAIVRVLAPGPTRLGIVARLCATGSMSIVRFTEGARVTRQAVTKHLHILAGRAWCAVPEWDAITSGKIDPARLGEAKLSAG